jgi:hypothetical protein
VAVAGGERRAVEATAGSELLARAALADDNAAGGLTCPHAINSSTAARAPQRLTAGERPRPIDGYAVRRPDQEPALARAESIDAAVFCWRCDRFRERLVRTSQPAAGADSLQPFRHLGCVVDARFGVRLVEYLPGMGVDVASTGEKINVGNLRRFRSVNRPPRASILRTSCGTAGVDSIPLSFRLRFGSRFVVIGPS